MPTGRSTRSKIAASSFSGLFTRVEIGQMVIGSAGLGDEQCAIVLGDGDRFRGRNCGLLP
jgi:hypothetical protein